jgi:hypothetical protein
LESTVGTFVDVSALIDDELPKLYPTSSLSPLADTFCSTDASLTAIPLEEIYEEIYNFLVSSFFFSGLVGSTGTSFSSSTISVSALTFWMLN